MLMPFAYDDHVDHEHVYKVKYLNSLKKAKHLAERFKQFEEDLNKSKFKNKDKQAILAELYRFTNPNFIDVKNKKDKNG